ncbi:MAG TPA: hypothetical protein VFZ52_22510 [Chryseolinea sp.]
MFKTTFNFEPMWGCSPEDAMGAYLLIPASLHTTLREPHTHNHTRPSVWLLIFLVLSFQGKKNIQLM